MIKFRRISFWLKKSARNFKLTTTPASRSACILSAAVPFPPDIIAPAWPILLPGGAVTPAMKETTGFFPLPELLSFKNSAASSSAEPPISPIRMIPKVNCEHFYNSVLLIIPFVSGSSRNTFKQSMKLVPLNGSPPIPTHKVCPNPTWVVWWTASYVRVPDRETIPMQPLKNYFDLSRTIGSSKTREVRSLSSFLIFLQQIDEFESPGK